MSNVSAFGPSSIASGSHVDARDKRPPIRPVDHRSGGKTSGGCFGSVAVRLGGTSFRLLCRTGLGPGYGRFVVMRGWGGLLSRLPNRGYNLALVRWLPHDESTGDVGACRALVPQNVSPTLFGAIVVTAMTGSESAWRYVMVGHALVGSAAALSVARRTDSAVDVAIVATAVTVSWNVWLIRIGGSRLGVWCIPKPIRGALRLRTVR